MGKLGFFIPRTLSNVLSTSRYEDEPEAFHVSDRTDDVGDRIRRRNRISRDPSESLPQRVVRIGRTIVPSSHSSGRNSRATSMGPAPLSTVATAAQAEEESRKRIVVSSGGSEPQRAEVQRTIRFPDEEPVARRDSSP